MKPRILPITIVALSLLLVEKTSELIGLTEAGFSPRAAAAEPDAKSAPPPSTPALPPGPRVSNWDSSQPPPAVCPPQNTLNPGEVAVLSALRQRATALDAREAALDRKQALVDAASKSLVAQIAGLQAVEDRLNALAKSKSDADEARWQALVSTYSAMDPEAAAGIFNGLDDSVLLPVLTRMSAKKSAVILAAMDPDKARKATELMAGPTQNNSAPPAIGQ